MFFWLSSRTNSIEAKETMSSQVSNCKSKSKAKQTNYFKKQNSFSKQNKKETEKDTAPETGGVKRYRRRKF
jgi:flagellar basal body rod protein FlgC